MSGPIHRRENLRNLPRLRLADVLERQPANHQRMFNYAMELISRRNKTINNEIVAKAALRRLARAGRTWTNRPSSIWITDNNSNANSNSNSNSNPSAGLVYGSNSNSNLSNNSNNNRSPASPNNSKVRKFAERWRLKGPVKLVNLPANKNNRTDPVTLHTFRSGQEAIQHQRRNTEGRIISTRYYLLPTIERLAGVNWKTIRRMHPNKVLVKEAGKGNKFLATKHLPNVITRLPIYRRNLTLVKFKSTS
jgi:hypothetical protein